MENIADIFVWWKLGILWRLREIFSDRVDVDERKEMEREGGTF